MSPPSKPPPHGVDLGERFGEGRRAALSLDEQRALALVSRGLFGAAAAKPLRLGRYELHERLGSGGLGVVYRAWDPLLLRPAAVKLLRLDVEADAAASGGAQAHLRESQRVARLEHPGIVNVLAAGSAGDGTVYVVMEFLPGGTLEDWLAAEERSTEEIVGAFEQAASALAAAHEQGVLHRDFKPANVMLDAEQRVRVVDFGTHGTAGFMPPEQERGEGLDERADVYALCVSLRAALGARTVPAVLTAALRRGTTADREARLPNVEALLRAVRPRRSRHVPFALAAGVVAALGLAFVPSRSEPCVVPQLERPAQLATSLQETADGFADAWDSTAADGFCDPDRKRVRACLEVAQTQWRGTLAAIGAAPEAPGALLLLDGLARPSGCSEAHLPFDPPQTPLDASFRELRLEIQASQRLGTWATRGPELLEALASMRNAALVAGNASVESGAALYLGVFEQRDGNVDEARRLYREAYVLAVRDHDATMAYYAADRMSYALGAYFGDASGAALWMDRARQATSQRAEPSAEAELLLLEARFASTSGAFEDAIAFFDAAEQAFDDDTSLVSWEELYSGRGDAKQKAGKLEQAVEDYQRVLDKLSALPDNSLNFVYALQGLGGTLLALGRLDEAEVALLRIRDVMLEQQPDSPDVAAVRFNLSQLYSARGEHEAALTELQAVRERFEAYGGPKHPGATAARSAMAEQYEALGRLDDARTEAEAALRWEVPPEYAAGAHLVLARREIAAGSKAAAKARLVALIEEPLTPPEARDVAEKLATSLTP